MTLEEFAENLRQDVLVRGSDSSNYEVDVFTEDVIEAMTDAGEADGFILCNCDGRGYKINAYNVSSDGDCIDLFVSIYTRQVPPQRVPAADLDRHFSRLRGFFQRALTDNFRAGLEESSPEFDAADSIHSSRGDVTRGRLFLLTDGLTSAREYQDAAVDGVNFTHHVWDIQRIFRMESSGTTREAIDVKFEDFGDRVACIRSADPAYEYATYVGYFPAALLVRIYERYGARLLERNVRSFLQARGKINRGIRDTILHEPQRFLAYNNGISATAERVEFEMNAESVIFLTRAVSFQIVNGGQTTASLYTAVKKDKADVSGISVQVKLTVPKDPASIDQLAPRISLYANSQNKVNTADFSANSPFHLRIEELSRTIWAPALAGTQIETRWYYERARGSYNDALARAGTAGERKRWKIQHPVSQKFTKTDLAKFEHTWDQKPHTVSRGAEKNFVEFMAELLEKRPPIPDESYFRHLIAKAILFRRAEKLVQAQNYGGYRANVVTYTLAWLSHHTAQKIDLERIWRAQVLLQELDEAIRIVSKAAYDHLVEGAQGGNVTEWAKKERCWEKFRTCEIGISSGLLRPVVTQHGIPHGIGAVVWDGTADLESYARIRVVPAEEWFAISGWAKETGNLAPWQRGLAYSLGRLAALNKAPSTKQVQQGEKILIEARRLGFRMN
ncbi:MAG TPA: AIPR family protein [Bryobacteraceae bacterium]|nr:AIPR family protein [Bryobacteraceae bacterium]